MSSFRTVRFEDPHRRKHFDFFRRMDQPHFSLVAQVDISTFLRSTTDNQLPFTAAIVYLLSRTANDIPSFRQRIRGEEVIEHERVHPSFTVPTANSDVFSFCYLDYQPEPAPFLAAAQRRSAEMYLAPSFADEPGRDDLLFLSAIPWVSFTGLTHAMHYSPVDSVPRISWGKYFPEGKKVQLPLAVQAHHALVDGRHMGEYFQQFQQLLDESENIFANT